MINLLLSKFAPYVLIALLVALSAVGGRLWYLNSKVESQKETISNLNAKAVTDKETIRKTTQALTDTRIERDKANQETLEFLNKQKAIDDENKKLRTCVANGTCGVRINRATCPPAVPATGANTSGSTTTDIRLDAGLQQDILGFAERIKHNQLVTEQMAKALQENQQKCGNQQGEWK